MILADNIDLPIITNAAAMQDKDIDYRLLLYLIELSNFNVIDDKDYRFLYINKLNKYMPKISEEMGITDKTILKKINLMRQAKIIEPFLVGEEVCLKIKVKESEKDFVILSHEEREQLQKLKSRAIKTYLVIKYTLEYVEDKKIQLVYLSGRIGASTKNVTPIKKIIEQLKDTELIDFYTKRRTKLKINELGKFNSISVREYFFELKKTKNVNRN